MVIFNEETGLYMIKNHEQLFPVIIEAMTEQQAQIEQGKKERDTQQKQIEKLEQMILELQNTK